MQVLPFPSSNASITHFLSRKCQKWRLRALVGRFGSTVGRLDNLGAGSTVGRNVKIRLEFWFLNSQWLPLSNKLTIWEWGLNLAWILEHGRTFHPRDSGNPGSVAIWGAKDLEMQILAILIYFFIVVVVLEKYMKGGIVCVTLPLMLQLRNDKRGEVCTVCTCCTLHSAKISAVAATLLCYRSWWNWVCCIAEFHGDHTSHCVTTL